MKKLFLLAIGSSILLSSCGTKNEETSNTPFETKTMKDKNGMSYEMVEGDPMNVRLYTLENGLKVYISPNDAEPRIQTLISVKAGSTYDPKETTGLAHYLEHMMFKGTSNLGSSNWEAEKVLLDEVSNLFEAHKNETDPEKKKAIYVKIDSVSQEASKFSIPNEYDKLMSSFGAKGTNAYTSNEETVYINDIPSNEFNRWAKLERERFGELVLRLFHTELETVYEEFNRGQDSDFRKSYQALNKNLYPTHPYGQQTTIGEAEHLKNPSMVNIHNYWNTYYRANNMAIILAGDLNPDEAIQTIKANWSDLPTNDNLEKPTFAKEQPITAPVEVEVYGPDAAYLQMGFRFDGIASEDEKMVTLIQNLLSNRTAGLVDLNLVQQQKILQASVFSNFLKDYGDMQLYAAARDGQDLNEVKELLLGEIDKIKKGEFEEEMMEAVLNNLKLSEIRKREENYRAYFINDAFVRDIPWSNRVKFLDDLSQITKQQIVDFANKKINDNYVIVYKRTGKDENIVKVEKPQITPIEINRDAESEFLKTLSAEKASKIEPVFVDYKTSIQTSNPKEGLTLHYVKNIYSELSEMAFIIDLGKNEDPKIPFAFDYLNYLGTETKSAEDVKKEFYKLGVNFRTFAADNRCYVRLSGLESTMPEAVKLLEDIMHNAKADEASYNEFVKGIIKKRSDSKLNKDEIKWSGLYSYAMYGKNSPFMNDLSNEELENLDPNELTKIIDDIFNYEHRVMYYGSKNQKEVEQMVMNNHQMPETLTPLPEAKKFEYQNTDNNKVYFVDYDMVQADIMMIAKGPLFDKTLMPMSELFNEFYGRGLSSIVFQEIRESKGLAYSAYASYSAPSKKEDPHFLRAFVGSQPDKLKDAVGEMIKLMNEMPEADKQFEMAKEALLSKMESERLIKTRVFWSYLNNLDKGLDYDIRKDNYETIKRATLDDMKQFFDNQVKGNQFTIALIASKKDLNKEVLASFGNVVELNKDELFPY
jgi:zinc protease